MYHVRSCEFLMVQMHLEQLVPFQSFLFLRQWVLHVRSLRQTCTALRLYCCLIRDVQCWQAVRLVYLTCGPRHSFPDVRLRWSTARAAFAARSFAAGITRQERRIISSPQSKIIAPVRNESFCIHIRWTMICATIHFVARHFVYIDRVWDKQQRQEAGRAPLS